MKTLTRSWQSMGNVAAIRPVHWSEITYGRWFRQPAHFLAGGAWLMPLTYGQLHILTLALQISMPVLMIALVVAYRALVRGRYEPV